jgi:hypothetical protein
VNAGNKGIYLLPVCLLDFGLDVLTWIDDNHAAVINPGQLIGLSKEFYSNKATAEIVFEQKGIVDNYHTISVTNCLTTFDGFRYTGRNRSDNHP